MLCLWRRMGEGDRGRLWRLYGWFSGLTTCGSCFGAVAWAVNMMQLVNFFKGNASARDRSLIALSLSWKSAFLVAYAVEFLCMCAAKLMVLDRMLVFAAPQGAGMPKLWATAGRFVMAAVVLGNAAGLVANAAAAVHYHTAAQTGSKASAAYAANNTNDGYRFLITSQHEAQLGGSLASVQSFLEVAVLLLIIVAFAAVGVLCARILNTRLKPIGLDAGYDAFMATVGRTLRRHMLGTTAFIFVTFLLRSAFSAMYAVAFQLRDIDKKCHEESTYCDATCYNVYTHIAQWMNFTPEFQLIIVLVSSPVAQLVALWGMTTKSTLHLMKTSRRDNALTLTLMQPKKKKKKKKKKEQEEEEEAAAMA
jgi:hypothetical protein